MGAGCRFADCNSVLGMLLGMAMEQGLVQEYAKETLQD
jgi:hypothetical protein